MFPEYLVKNEDPLRIRFIQHCDYLLLHRHAFLEFMYVTEGEGEEVVNGELRKLERGSFSLVLPCQTHQIRLVPGKRLRFYCVAARLDLLFTGLGIPGGVRDLLLDPSRDTRGMVNLPAPEAREMEGLLGRMLKEYQERDSWWQEGMYADLMRVFILFFRTGRERMAPVQVPPTTALGGLVWKILYHLYRHHHEHMDLDALAASHGLSQRRMRELFRTQLGMGVREFLLDLRIQNARSMLESTDMKVSDIALSSGFESYRNFVRLFEAHTGMSPSDCRARAGDVSGKVSGKVSGDVGAQKETREQQGEES